jgi:hypothetical protein
VKGRTEKETRQQRTKREKGGGNWTDLDGSLSDRGGGSKGDGREGEGGEEGGLGEDHLGCLKKAEGKGDGKRMEGTGRKKRDGIVKEGSLVS